MTALGIRPDARRRLSAPRIAEIVADELRRQIIDGELADGDLLPRQEVLVEQFNVSLVSLREALRILETEGLVSVRRGNRGGAVVHAPAKTSAAYMLGLLLQSESVAVADESAARGTYPSLAKRRAVLATHIKLAETIAEGDVDRARRIAGRHLADTQTYVLSGKPDQRIYALSPQALSRPRDMRQS